MQAAVSRLEQQTCSPNQTCNKLPENHTVKNSILPSNMKKNLVFSASLISLATARWSRAAVKYVFLDVVKTRTLLLRRRPFATVGLCGCFQIVWRLQARLAALQAFFHAWSTCLTLKSWKVEGIWKIPKIMIAEAQLKCGFLHSLRLQI